MDSSAFAENSAAAQAATGARGRKRGGVDAEVDAVADASAGPLSSAAAERTLTSHSHVADAAASSSVEERPAPCYSVDLEDDCEVLEHSHVAPAASSTPVVSVFRRRRAPQAARSVTQRAQDHVDLFGGIRGRGDFASQQWHIRERSDVGQVMLTMAFSRRDAEMLTFIPWQGIVAGTTGPSTEWIDRHSGGNVFITRAVAPSEFLVPEMTGSPENQPTGRMVPFLAARATNVCSVALQGCFFLSAEPGAGRIHGEIGRSASRAPFI